MVDRRKQKVSKEIKEKPEEQAEVMVSLSLKCPECDWEWTDFVDARMVYSKPQCPSCFHHPVLIMQIIGCFA